MAAPLIIEVVRNPDPHIWIQGLRANGTWMDLYSSRWSEPNALTMAKAYMKQLFVLDLPETADFEDFRLHYEVVGGSQD